MEENPYQEGADIIRADFQEKIDQLEQQLAQKQKEMADNGKRFEVLSKLEREYGEQIKKAYGDRLKELQDLRDSGEQEIQQLEKELIVYKTVVQQADAVAKAFTTVYDRKEGDL